MPVVLIVDDEDPVRRMFKEAFENAGFDVLEAPEGQTGIGLFGDKSPDLVVTDIQMPGKDGFDLIREIRDLDPGAHIIAITGAGVHNIPVAHEIGATKFFEKPVSPSELIKVAEELLA